jgi:hypothetical protein
MSSPNVMVDRVAVDSLSATGTSVEHMLEHHRAHLASDCGCLFGEDGQTAMRAPDGTVLIISEPESGTFFISGHQP